MEQPRLLGCRFVPKTCPRGAKRTSNFQQYRHHAPTPSRTQIPPGAPWMPNRPLPGALQQHLPIPRQIIPQGPGQFIPQALGQFIPQAPRHFIPQAPGHFIPQPPGHFIPPPQPANNPPAAAPVRRQRAGRAAAAPAPAAAHNIYWTRPPWLTCSHRSSTKRISLSSTLGTPGGD